MELPKRGPEILLKPSFLFTSEHSTRDKLRDYRCPTNTYFGGAYERLSARMALSSTGTSSPRRGEIRNALGHGVGFPQKNQDLLDTTHQSNSRSLISGDVENGTGL